MLFCFFKCLCLFSRARPTATTIAITTILPSQWRCCSCSLRLSSVQLGSVVFVCIALHLIGITLFMLCVYMFVRLYKKLVSFRYFKSCPVWICVCVCVWFCIVVFCSNYCKKAVFFRLFIWVFMAVCSYLDGWCCCCCCHFYGPLTAQDGWLAG